MSGGGDRAISSATRRLAGRFPIRSAPRVRGSGSLDFRAEEYAFRRFLSGCIALLSAFRPVPSGLAILPGVGPLCSGAAEQDRSSDPARSASGTSLVAARTARLEA